MSELGLSGCECDSFLSGYSEKYEWLQPIWARTGKLSCYGAVLVSGNQCFHTRVKRSNQWQPFQFFNLHMEETCIHVIIVNWCAVPRFGYPSEKQKMLHLALMATLC